MANSAVGTKNRPYRARLSVLNGETSAIAAGTPVYFSDVVNNTVKNPSSGSSAATYGLFAGIAPDSIPAGSYGDIVTAGYVAAARRVIRTRAASTDSWASVASVATAYWTIDTVNNAMASSGAAAAASGLPAFVNVATLASVASLASSTNNSDTVSYGTVALWVRHLT